MRDKVKRFVSILMTALMLVNLMPVGALADGITSGGYQQATIANGNQTVYLYVKVTGNLNGLNLNKSGWCTVGKVTGLNMTDPQSYAWWYGSSNHVSSVSGISASSVGKGKVDRWSQNQSIDLSKVTWSSGTSYGFLPVSTGADDYVGSGWTWHLDGYIDISQVKASYKIRYVDQDTGKVLKIADSGTDDPGVWIDHSAPKTLEGGYEIVGDTDRTFKLEQIDNTFDIYYRRPYGYKVEYYYDGVKDEHATVTGESKLWCGTEINSYTHKLKDGYTFDKDNCPLTIQADESKNVIKVYYKKIGYTVTYEPGEHGTFTAKAYNAKYGDATPAFDGETTGKPGWTFDGWEPEVAETVTENATYTAKFVPDKTKTATVLYTISIGQSDYGSIAPSAQQIILQATGKQANGDPISGSTATANAGYKFVGWYKATGEATYEWVTGDPELTSELAESKLNRDKETGLYQNTVFEARFEPDEKQTATVTYTAENGTVTHASDTILQADASGLTGSTALANTGYKFDGWYNGDEFVTDDLTLTPEMAKPKLNKNGNLYADTTFTAKFVPDTKQSAEVIYTTDGNGTLWGGPAIKQITQFVQIVTGEVVRKDGSVIGDKLTTIPTYPKDGYEFDRWIRVFPETTIEGADSALTDEKARPNLNQEDGLYQKTEFKAIFKPQTNLSYTVNYYWNGTEIPVKPSKTVLHQTFGAEATESPIGADDYTPVSNEPKKIKIGADSTQNVINFYYYRNVKLTANSDTKTYNGKNQSVSGYTCAVAEMKNGRLEYVPWTGEKPLIFNWISASGSGKDVNEKGYQVTFNESPIGEHDDLYYVKESQTGILMITPAPVTLQAPIASKTYDGTPLKAEDYGHSFVEGLDFADDFASISVEGSQTLVGSSASSVTYELKQGKIPNNYNIQCIPGTLTITPVMDEVLVKIKGNTANVTYDGKLHSVEGYAVDSISNPLYTASDFTYNGVAKAEGTDAGEYKMGLTAEKFTNISDNFSSVRFEVVTDGSLTISKRKVTLTSETASKPYDGTPLTKPNVTGGDGFVAGEVTDIRATGTITNVGSVTNTISYTPVEGKFNPDNYDIAEDPGTLTVTENEKVVVKVKGKTDTVPYDGDPHSVAGYEVVSIEIDGEATELYTKDDFEFDDQTNAKGTNAGTYAMVLDKSQFTNNNDNFKNVKFEVVEDGKLEIEKRNVKLTSASDSKPYDGTALTKPDVTIGGDGFVEGEVSDVKATGSVTNVSEGEVTNAITYTKGEKFNANNYAIEKDEGKLSISKRSVTLTSASDEKVYDGTPLTNETVAVTGDGFVGKEGATYDVTGSQTDVGESDNLFTFEVNEGTNPKNYTFEVALGTLKVTPVTEEVIVTITGRTDEMPYDGKEHSVFGYDVTVSNALYNPKEDMQFNGTDVDMTAKGTDAGTYPMKLTAEDFTNKSKTFSKVTFVVTDGYVKINPRPVTLTSETASKTYDGTALEKPVVTVGGDGFVEGQVKEIKATGSVTNAGSVANTITFTPNKETFKEGNYAITKTEGTLTIAKRSVLISSQSATKTYDGSALTRPAVTITGDGFVPGELAKAEATGSITKVGSTPNTIQYTTTGAFNAANYSIALSVGTLTVTEKPQPEPRRTFNLTINYVYQNGKRAASSYNRGGLKNGETFDITSPVIAGYTASETVVSGTIYNRDIKVTVIYTADGVNLDDYGVPLGLGNITMNVGDCFE